MREKILKSINSCLKSFGFDNLTKAQTRAVFYAGLVLTHQYKIKDLPRPFQVIYHSIMIQTTILYDLDAELGYFNVKKTYKQKNGELSEHKQEYLISSDGEFNLVLV